MATIDQIAKRLKGVLNRYQPALQSWPAYLGDGQGRVKGSDERHVLVRFQINDPAVEVYNVEAPLIDGMAVKVGFKAEAPDLLQVLSYSNDQRMDNAAYGFLRDHGPQHQWAGGDVSYIELRQWTPLRVFASGGYNVKVQQGVLPRQGVDVFIGEQTLDLTSHVPANGIRYVLITLDDSGVITATDGIVIGSLADLGMDDVPTTPAGHFRLAAVRMYTGQTSIADGRSNTDILDLRWPQESVAGISGSGSATSIFFLNHSTGALIHLAAIPSGSSENTYSVGVDTLDLDVLFATCETFGGSPGTSFLTGGSWSLYTAAYAGNADRVKLSWKLYELSEDGLTETLLIGSDYSSYLTASPAFYTISALAPDTAIESTNTLRLKIYATLKAGTTTTATIAIEGTNYSRFSLASQGSSIVDPSQFEEQVANTVLARPTTGADADPTFRALVDADIPAAIARDSELNVHDHIGGDGAAIAEGAFSFSDVTTANADVSQHGLLPKLSGMTLDVLHGDGTFAPVSGVGQYRQFVYEVSGGDFTFIRDELGQPVMALEDLE